MYGMLALKNQHKWFHFSFVEGYTVDEESVLPGDCLGSVSVSAVTLLFWFQEDIQPIETGALLQVPYILHCTFPQQQLNLCLHDQILL